MSWNSDILAAIDRADDLKIAPYRPDCRTTGTPTWIWEVVIDDRLFVRAYSGNSSSWYQAAAARRSGRIHAVGQQFEVRFSTITDSTLNDKIDEAYRQKYADSRYMPHMLTPSCRAATVEILPVL